MREERFEDLERAKWPSGEWQDEPDKLEWQDEPDKLEWQDEPTGLPCLIVRNQSGSLCGYVGLPPGHPWHGLTYSDCTKLEARPKGPVEPIKLGNMAEPDSMRERREKQRVCGEETWCDHRVESLVEVHGGLTYSDKCRGRVCHTPEPGDSDDVWWLGFDCSHAWDVTPAIQSLGFSDPTASYKNVGYVQRECARLAEQLAAVVP